MPKRRPKFSPLIPVQLTQVTTSDGVDLAGVVVEPKGRKRAALIWLHGLTSSFDSGQTLMQLLSQACARQGIGYFKFNTRGHHLVDYGSHGQKVKLIGASYERFQDCLKDIRAMIAFAKRLGYRKIILAGHSTGANKALFYAVRANDRSVRAVLLAAPASDIAGELKKLSATALLKRVAQARVWAKKNPDRLVPASWGPWSAGRYVSLFTPGAPEDTFPYHRLGGRWTLLRQLRQPMLVVIGQRDKYIDRPANRLIELFGNQARRTRAFTGLVIPKAEHGFRGHQPELTRQISRWMKTVVG